MSVEKKLSLEQRLSLAARKGKKKSRVGRPGGSAVTPEPAVVSKDGVVQDPLEVNDDAAAAGIEGGFGAAGTAAYDTDLYSKWVPETVTEMDAVALLALLAPHIRYLQDKLSAKDDSSLMRLVKEKDATVEKLRADNEQSLQKLRDSSKTIDSLGSMLKRCRGELSETRRGTDALSQQNSQLQRKLDDSLDEIKQYSGQTELVQRLQLALSEKTDEADSVRNESSRLQNELSKLQETLETEKVKSTHELNLLKESSCEQINSLETKLEQLRIQLENVTLQGSAETDSKSNEDWSTQYAMLQEQFNSSKSNWNSIEFSLNSKLAKLKSEMESLQEENSKLSTQLKQTKESLRDVQVKLGDTESERVVAQSTITKLRENVNALNKNCDDLRDDYALLQKKYALQRSQLEGTILQPAAKTTTHSMPPFEEDQDLLKKLENEWASSVSQDVHESPINEELLMSTGTPDLSRVETQELFMNNGSSSMPTTPVLTDSRNNSFFNGLGDIPEEASALKSLNNKKSSASLLNLAASRRKSSLTQMVNNGPSENNTVINETNAVSNAASAQQINTQLVSRLGSEVRRLESELSSLQQAYETLQEEKDASNSEILKLMEENDETKKIKLKNEDLQRQVTTLQAQLETALQLLGEKTERVEELENDVEDLKEMMQQQVQQMIELQEKLR
ncbi:Sgm1p KNAG_0B06780 [Huiozyma naganishii CBS 8797]|uniref:TATA element modulatory factor 1 TATA binding domain-containing protein n=1 Tax=Huiozyma naganishii (strain ATCC MYA-139 / BCRC 22969 / CBS 8797 / KCTC 17520 / NBRC 10181 / NCYC 3082 / Yp74L-3) TaxID=1071383 RepID=J7RHT3_HUIN7|nr:hypothetical protein KNAG_0B06780 [Kazachstania naganishii CBS 8797]CCK69103.1 hypothetical protein KNAG_0B06780 [Kazachstania naganishii CBS 8797]